MGLFRILLVSVKFRGGGVLFNYYKVYVYVLYNKYIINFSIYSNI